MPSSNMKTAHAWLLVAALGGCQNGGDPERALPSNAVAPSSTPAAGSGAAGAASAGDIGTKPAPQTSPQPSTDASVPPSTQTPVADPRPVIATTYALAKADNCAEAERDLRNAAVTEMNAQLDANLNNYLRTHAGRQAPLDHRLRRR
jgi:hypothetical protein